MRANGRSRADGLEADYACRVGLSEAELAERSGSSVEKVLELERLGILVRREESGPFAVRDVHRVRLMDAFEAAGIPLELIAQGVAAGKLSY